MKYFSRLLLIAGFVFGLSACSDILTPKDPIVDEVPVQISFSLADKSVQTKSKVSGTETGVHSMQMVCFDANGLYLGIRNATLVDQVNNSTPYTGKIKGTVPQGTARIHFIANRGLTIPLSYTVGTQEETVMLSEELSTIWNDTNHQEICYWGYHKEANETDMQSWLNPTAGSRKVYLIRDRAKVELTYDATGAPVPVTKIEWLIHNGRERGYLAPAKVFWNNDPATPTTPSYYGYSSVTGNTLVSKAGMNEYTGCRRYSLWISADENDENNFDVAYQSTGTYTPQSQFLFDDDNTALDDVKVILRVTYTVNGSPKVVYHTLRLNDDEKVRYDIVRNNTYYINCTNLRPDVAFYETLKEAIDGDEFVNAEVEVDRTITDINDNTYTLQIKLPTETTSIVFNTVGLHDEMNFVFRKASDLSEVTTDPADFEVTWEKTQSFCTAPTVTYDENTKQFVIHTSVIAGQVTSTLQSQWLVVKHKDSGLTRYIHVYVIDQFKFLGVGPTLTKVGNDYLLSFTIPKPDYSDPDNPDPSEKIYPAGLYPIDVKFTTNTLNAYGITQGRTNYGLFGVSVEGTSQLCDEDNFEIEFNDPVSSTDFDSDRTHWYFQQENNYWDFWYTYSLKTYPTNGEGTEDDGVVNIYFKDVRDHIKYANVSDVGLFLYIKYFGKNYSVPVKTNP